MRKAFALFLISALFVSLGLSGAIYAQHVGVTATPHSVTLSWTPSTVPTGAPAVSSITVYRGNTAGGETLLQNVQVGALPACPAGVPAGNTQCFVDSTVTAGLTYFYQVSSSNSAGESGKSAEVSVTIPNNVAPNAPTNLTGVAQ